MKRIRTIILYIFLSFLLCGCTQKTNTASKVNVESAQTDLDQFISYLIDLNYYSYDPNLIETWNLDEKQSQIEQLKNTKPAAYSFVKASMSQFSGEEELAYTYYGECIKQANQRTEKKLLAKCYYEFAVKSLYENSYDAAIVYMDKIDALFENEDNRDLQIALGIGWAFEVLGTEDGVERAMDYILQIRDIAEEHNYKNMTYVYYQVAFVCSYSSNSVLANEYYVKALNLAKENNDTYWLYTINTDIAVNYLIEERYAEAKDYIFDAYDSVQDLVSSDPVADCYDKIYITDRVVEYYEGIQDYEQEKIYLTQEKEIIDSLPEAKLTEDYYTKYLCSLALYEASTKDYRNAITHILDAEKRYTEASYFSYTNFDIYLYETAAEVYWKANNIDKALEYYNKAEEGYYKTGEESSDLVCMESLYNIYKDLNEYDSALRYADAIIESYKLRYYDKENATAEYMLEEFQVKEKEIEIEKLKYKNRNLNVVIAFTILIIIVAIIYSVLIMKKSKQIKELNGKLKQMSESDELTRLNNRRSLNNYIDNQWKEANTNHLPISLAMLDVDYFKAYNDHYGHLAGDEVLRKVAQSIKDDIRMQDFAVRYGGEEFLIIMPGTDEAQANKVMQSIQQTLMDFQIEHEESSISDYITVSIGIASTYQSHSFMKMIHIADQALYDAKQKRNSICSQIVEN